MAAQAFDIEVLPGDAPAAAIAEWLAIRNAIDVWPISAESFALRTAAEIAAQRLGVRVNGRLVGIGAAAWDVIRAGSDEATVQIYVLPGSRGIGIGSALWPRLTRFVREGGIANLASRVIAGDTGSLGFATRRGLAVVGMQQVGTLELDPLDPPGAPALPAGVTIAAMGERLDLHPALHAHMVAILPEVPSWGDAPVPTYAAWQDMIAEPGYRRDLSLIALDGNTIVGQIDVDNDGEGSAFISMLTVAPGARRRGIARALKQELAHRACEAGWRELATVNDGTNDGIRRLNEDLGYRYLPEVLLLHGPVPAA